MRTQGEAFVQESEKLILCGSDIVGATWMSDRPHEEDCANAHTWATAHNTANAIDALGLDGLKAMGPELNKMVSLAKHYMWERYDTYSQDQLKAMLGGMLYDFMQSIKREGE